MIIFPSVSNYRILRTLYNNLHSLIYAVITILAWALVLQADETDEQAKFLLTVKTISLRGV